MFSGAGGLDLGFVQAGIQVLWANDINKFACETYRKNLGEHIISGSINLIDFSILPKVDVVIGGPPCQGFSVAGKMDLNDSRSKLIWTYQSIIKTLMPKCFVMENVAALGRLEKFSTIRENLLSKYREIGYAVDYKILNSKDYGVPQSRERFILIGILGGSIIPFPKELNKIISARESLVGLDDPGQGNNLGECFAKISLAKRPVLRKSPYAGMIFNGRGRAIDLEKPSQTLIASMGGAATPILETNLMNNPSAISWVKTYHKKILREEKLDLEVPSFLRRITVREAARLQGFPDDFVFCGSKGQQYKQIGNSVPPPLALHIANTIKKMIE